MKKILIPVIVIITFVVLVIVFAATKKSCPKGYSTRTVIATGHTTCHGPSGEWFSLETGY